MTRLYGIDFSCAPTRRKPITVASGRADAGGPLRLESLDELRSLADFSAWLRTPGPWLGGFDFPFGLPRVFVESNRLGTDSAEVIAAVRRRWPTRMSFRAAIDAWGNARPAGARLVHRVTDLAGEVASTSPLQTRYVPVGLMYHAGVAALVEAGVALAGLQAGDAQRVALEAYPRRLAHAIVGRRSYKNATTGDREAAREVIVATLEASRELRIDDAALRRSLLADASGDRLDAVLCLVQAARVRERPRYGMPADVDVVEGWIVG